MRRLGRQGADSTYWTQSVQEQSRREILCMAHLKAASKVLVLQNRQPWQESESPSARSRSFSRGRCNATLKCQNILCFWFQNSEIMDSGNNAIPSIQTPDPGGVSPNFRIYRVSFKQLWTLKGGQSPRCQAYYVQWLNWGFSSLRIFMFLDTSLFEIWKLGAVRTVKSERSAHTECQSAAQGCTPRAIACVSPQSGCIHNTQFCLQKQVELPGWLSR